ncbi:MAG TPA: SCO family protein [Bacteroidia bacterium]|jgi:protein SCO1/2|nr:SCO family protein [Bacteroidia bacterium]
MATSGKTVTINIVLFALAFTALGIAFMRSNSKKPLRSLPYIGVTSVDSAKVDGKYKVDTIYHKVLDFKLTDQFGQTVTLDTFKNKVFIANFFFAQCPGICKRMNSLLETATFKFKGNPYVKFVSYTVDPVRDSVPVMLEYAKMHDATPYQWYFLTGDKNEIYNLARKSYYAAVDDSAGGNFVHTQNMALVDMQGHIRGIYSGTDSTEINKMVIDINLLLQEEVPAK